MTRRVNRYRLQIFAFNIALGRVDTIYEIIIILNCTGAFCLELRSGFSTVEIYEYEAETYRTLHNHILTYENSIISLICLYMYNVCLCIYVKISTYFSLALRRPINLKICSSIKER